MAQLVSGYLTDALAVREQTHRRATLVAIAGLLLLSTSPVFGHHVSGLGESALSGLDHLGSLCLTALHLLLEPVHQIFHIVIVAGVLYAIWDRARAWYLIRAALGPLDARVPVCGDPFWVAAQRAGIDARIIRVVDGLPSPAFTVGWFTPRIYAAAALAERLDPAELASVLAHEGAHVARRDPLRLSLLRFFACTLFWIPALRRLADDLADEAEVLADDAAARDPLVLASAILAVAQWEAPARGRIHVEARSTVGFVRPDLLERRIRRLAGEDARVRTHVTRRSVFTAALALALVWSSGVLVAHPLSAEERAHHGRHCHHRGTWAITHLFCAGPGLGGSADECPHADRATAMAPQNHPTESL